MRVLVVMLDGTRIYLREHAQGDHAAVLGYSSDETVARYVPWEPNNNDGARAFLAAAIAAPDQTPRVNYELAIVERATERLVGAARIGIESLPHKRAELATGSARWLGRRIRDRGSSNTSRVRV